MEKGHKSDTERKTGDCSQRKTVGYCSRRDSCGFLHTHAAGDREENVARSGGRKKILA